MLKRKASIHAEDLGRGLDVLLKEYQKIANWQNNLQEHTHTFKLCSRDEENDNDFRYCRLPAPTFKRMLSGATLPTLTYSCMRRISYKRLFLSNIRALFVEHQAPCCRKSGPCLSKSGPFFSSKTGPFCLSKIGALFVENRGPLM